MQAGAAGDAKRAERVLDRVLDPIARTTDSDRLQALGKTAQQIASANPNKRTAATVLNALKFPTSALGGVDEMLLEGLRPCFPGMPPAAAGFWAAIDWVREQHPEFNLDAPPSRLLAPA